MPSSLADTAQCSSLCPYHPLDRLELSCAPHHLSCAPFHPCSDFQLESVTNRSSEDTAGAQETLFFINSTQIVTSTQIKSKEPVGKCVLPRDEPAGGRPAGLAAPSAAAAAAATAAASAAGTCFEHALMLRHLAACMHACASTGRAAASRVR